MKRLIVLIFTLTIGISLLGCTKISYQQPSTERNKSQNSELSITKIQNTEELINFLKKSNSNLKYSKEDNSWFLSGSLTIADFDGDTIGIYEYKNNQEMEQDAKNISSDGYMIGNSFVEWVAKPHFYKSGNIIVNYIGDNKEMIKKIEKLMGQQFAGGK